ncbi:MAG: NUDIX hydrolase [Actinomycetota bacterium]|nr:NUDIX hydrolase [Actinomycetota bacterium]
MERGRWRTLGVRYLYENPWCSFRVDEVLLPDGVQIEYGILESEGFAAVVPVTEGGGVVLVRQWRQPVGGFTLELPGGGVEGGEDPREAVTRELLEETGYRAEDLSHLVSVHTSPGRSTEVCHLFRCKAMRALSGSRPEPTEFVSTVELPLAEAVGEIFGGGITAATTVLGLLMVSDGMAGVRE